MYAAGAAIRPAEDVLSDALWLSAHPGWNAADLDAAPAELIDVMRMVALARARESRA